LSEITKRIYLDHSATTPVDERALAAMLPFFTQTYGNATSIHSFGQEAKVALENARRKIAAVIGATPGEIIFTAGGTESNNWAIKGAALHYGDQKKHIITATTEHHAVLHTCRFLEKQGFNISFARVDEHGAVDPERISAMLRDDTFLISIMHANNEVGTINPIVEIAQIAHDKGILFHTDAVQSYGKIPIDVGVAPIDLLSISAHKIYGPKGIGALYMRQGTKIAKFLHGGRHERDRRAGTENIAAAVGFGAATEISHDKTFEGNDLRHLRDLLQAKILAGISGVRVNGHPENRLPNLLNLSIEGVESDSLLLSLDLKGIAVSNGSACTSGTIEPSHVLQAMGVRKDLAKSALRFSFGRQNCLAEVDACVEALIEIVTRLRKFKKRRDSA